MIIRRNSPVCFLWLITLAAATLSQAQLKKEDVGRFVKIHELEHPYLFFTNAEKPKLLERIVSDPECRKIMAELVAESNRFVRMPFSKRLLLQPEHPRYETENEAISYLAEISKGALTLAFVYQMTGNAAYTTRAIEYAEAICDVPEWVHRAHSFDIIYPRVWPWNVPDDQVVFSYDLQTARILRVLSPVYDWLYPVMTKQQRDKIRGRILEKAITPVRGNYEFFWWSTAYRCNWSAICFGGLGLSALALLRENPQLVDVVAESHNRINLTFDQIGDEGGWQEGRGYFGYMIHSAVYFMDALKRLSGNNINLFSHPKIRANAFDFQLYALTASFGDSEGYHGGPTHAVNKLVSETGSRTSAFYRDKFLGEGDDIFDIIWPRSSVPGAEPSHKSRFFKNIHWAILRSDFFDSSTVTIACKAGLNDDPHHGHLDCGQFAITWHKIPFVKDLGSLRYDEYYFNNERFDYLHASSEGHNVLSVNGEQQIIAKRKNEKWKEHVGGKILDYRSDEKRDYVLMDPTRSYPGKELKKWRRNIILEKPVITLVVDEVVSNVGATIRSRFFPGVDEDKKARRVAAARVNFPPADAKNGNDRHHEGVRVMSTYVVLTDHQGHSMALVPLILNNEFKIIEDRMVDLVVIKDAVPEWSRYVDVVTVAQENTTIMSTVILPVENDEDAEGKVKSLRVRMVDRDTFVVSMNNPSQSLQWVFERTNDGLVLK